MTNKMLGDIIKRLSFLLWFFTFMQVCCISNGQNSDRDDEFRVNISDVNAAGEDALRDMQRLDDLEAELIRKGLVLQRNSAAYFHQALFKGNPEQSEEAGRNGLIETRTAVNLQDRLSGVLSREQMNRIPLQDTVISDTCPRPPRCLDTRFRSIDGSCNNRDNLSWGKSFTALMRLLPPAYADGIDLPRTTGFGNIALPSARLISSRVSPDVSAPSSRISIHFMEWGQFLDHDITNTALTTASNGAGPICCSEEIQRNRTLLHPACFPIQIPVDDPFYSPFNSRCMEFVRSRCAPTQQCTLGARQQLNMLTSFIDGSMIYGSVFNESLNLRSFERGQLRSARGQANILPADLGAACVQDDPPCLLAGDNRVNEQTLLTIYHQIWFREHNRIAGILSRINPGWKDEALYQETRRIVGAMIQHITYNEFLPILLGQRMMGEYQLNLQWNGHSQEYDPEVNPTISNVFATAAYRLGHTLVEGLLRLVTETRAETGNLQLRTQFFNPVAVYNESSFDNLLRGMSRTPSQNFDNYVSDELTKHLFGNPAIGFGLDLVSLNIQRGRDHGLPGYNKWREFCGLQVAESFQHLESFIRPAVATAFSELYGDVDDVDLFIAGISENTVDRDAILPPTFGCLVAEQFRRLKIGDRLWYENGYMEGAFTEDQLNEIRKVTLSRVLCDNANIQSIPKNAFLLESRRNRVEGCIQGKIPRMNLETWKNDALWE